MCICGDRSYGSCAYTDQIRQRVTHIDVEHACQHTGMHMNIRECSTHRLVIENRANTSTMWSLYLCAGAQ